MVVLVFSLSSLQFSFCYYGSKGRVTESLRTFGFIIWGPSMPGSCSLTVWQLHRNRLLFNSNTNQRKPGGPFWVGAGAQMRRMQMMHRRSYWTRGPNPHAGIRLSENKTEEFTMTRTQQLTLHRPSTPHIHHLFCSINTFLLHTDPRVRSHSLCIPAQKHIHLFLEALSKTPKRENIWAISSYHSQQALCEEMNQTWHMNERSAINAH